MKVRIYFEVEGFERVELLEADTLEKLKRVPLPTLTGKIKSAFGELKDRAVALLDWKEVPAFPGMLASSCGLIQVDGYLRKQHRDYLGYLRVRFGKKNYRVHRLVAFAWIPNPLERSEINHRNGVKTDNRADNLEWCTRSENIRHSFETGLREAQRGSTSPRTQLTEAIVAEIKADCLDRKNSATILARKYGVGRKTIEHIRYGGSWKHVRPAERAPRSSVHLEKP